MKLVLQRSQFSVAHIILSLIYDNNFQHTLLFSSFLLYAGVCKYWGIVDKNAKISGKCMSSF